MTDNRKLDKAKANLVWYIRLLAQGPFQFDSDNQVEIEEIVDAIFEAAVEEAVRRIRQQMEAAQ